MEDLKGVSVLPQETKEEIPAKKFRLSKWSERYNEYISEGRRTFKQFLTDVAEHVITLLLAIAVAFALTAILIGNGAYVYSEDQYDKVKTAVTDFAKSDRSLEELKKLEGKVDNAKYTRSNGRSKLICNIKNGFFNAKVTANLLDDSSEPQMKRNFENRTAYTIHFYGVFGVCTIIGGFMAWFLLYGICYLIPFLDAKLYEACQKHKNTRQNKQLMKKNKKQEKVA